jgi:hypothetical protein
VPRSVLSDMAWWTDVLSVSGAARSLVPRGTLEDVGVWVDASTSWGIGIVVNGGCAMAGRVMVEILAGPR